MSGGNSGQIRTRGGHYIEEAALRQQPRPHCVEEPRNCSGPFGPLQVFCCLTQALASILISMKTYDAIVVGAGHNGLTSAAFLAKAGLNVLCVEKNEYIGGATVSRNLYKDWIYSNC